MFPAREGCAFFDEVNQTGNEGRVGTCGCGAGRSDSEAFAGGERFSVEIVDDFHVVGDESDGRDNNGCDTLVGERFEVVVDIRFEPGLMRWARTRAVGEAPGSVGRSCCCHPVVRLGGEA